MPLIIRPELSWWGGPDRRREWGLAAAVGLLALVLRLWGASTREPTLGEMAASTAAVTPFWQVFTGPSSEQCPPLLWALLWPVAALSGGALELLRGWLALISALCCALVIPMFRGILKPNGAVIAAFILAVHPAAVMAGRTVGPEALVLPAFLLAIYCIILTVDDNRFRNWLQLDIALILLLTSHRGAVVAAGGLLMVHLGLIAYRVTHPKREAWAAPRESLLLQLLGHYGITGLISLPVAVVILKNPAFPVEPFDIHSFRDWIGTILWAGQVGERPWWAIAVAVAGWLLVVPGFAGGPAKSGWRVVVPAVVLGTIVLLTVGISFAPGGFKFGGVDLAGLTAPALALFLGGALGHASRPVRLTGPALLTLGWMLAGTPIAGPELPIRAVMTRAAEIRKPGEPVLVWPPYLNTALHYYLGSSAGQGDLEGFLTGIEEPPANTRIHVVLIRWPEDSARTITLRGALALHSRHAEVWKAGPRGEVVSVTDVDRQLMAAWKADPRTLDTDDKPVPKLTMHLWVPTDDLFAKSDQFLKTPAETLFEPSGRRVAWTAKPEVVLEPRVGLPQGSYFVKVHCAPSPEEGPTRQVEVLLSAFDRKRFVVDGETTLSLAFTTAADLQTLPIRIAARPMMTAGSGRTYRTQGLKIYSISVEPPVPFP